MDSPAKPPMPSASVLTGSIPATKASTYLQKASEESIKVKEMPMLMPILKPHTPSRPATPSHRESATIEEKLSPLKQAVEKHTATLGKAHWAPQQRPSTAQRAVAKEEAQRLLEKMKQLSSKALASSDTRGEGEAPASAAAVLSELPGPALRPLSALSSREFSLPRPSSRLGKEATGDPVSSSWSGPLLTASSRPQSRAGTPRTPSHGRPVSRLGSGGNLLRRSLPATLLNAAMGESGRPTSPWQSSTKVKSQEGAGAASSTDLWINPLAAAHAGNPEAAIADRVKLERTIKNTSPDRGRVFSTRKIEELTGRKNKMEEFDMTRGSLFAVFTELDSCKEGRVTESMFAEAGYRIGMRREKIEPLFASLDKEGRGFLSLKEWGSRDMEEQVRAFSKLYLQVTRGPTGKLKDEPINDLYSALAYAMGKLSIRETGRISRISHKKVLETFAFIDSNRSNTIDEGELADCFQAMGVNITDEVIDEAMKTFDRDHSGTIDYFEFLSVLFPGLAKMARDSREDFS